LSTAGGGRCPSTSWAASSGSGGSGPRSRRVSSWSGARSTASGSPTWPERGRPRPPRCSPISPTGTDDDGDDLRAVSLLRGQQRPSCGALRGRRSPRGRGGDRRPVQGVGRHGRRPRDLLDGRLPSGRRSAALAHGILHGGPPAVPGGVPANPNRRPPRPGALVHGAREARRVHPRPQSGVRARRGPTLLPLRLPLRPDRGVVPAAGEGARRAPGRARRAGPRVPPGARQHHQRVRPRRLGVDPRVRDGRAGCPGRLHPTPPRLGDPPVHEVRGPVRDRHPQAGPRRPRRPPMRRSSRASNVPMMEPMKKLLIGLAAVALVLSACGKEPDQGGLPHVANPRGALLNAMVSAYEAGTMHEEFTMSMRAGSESFTFSGQADVDSERRRASMTMDLGMLGGSMDMIVDGGTIYMRSPQFSDAGTEWVSFDAEALGAASGSPIGGLGTGSMDPSAYAALFAGAVHVAERGTEEIDGVTTTHYVGTIDLAKAIGGIGKGIGGDARRGVVEEVPEARGQLG